MTWPVTLMPDEKATANKPGAQRGEASDDIDVDEPKRRKDGRLTKAERTKLKILQSAEKVFADRGYEGTTLDAVGEPVDVLGTAVLYHFKSKNVLYQETLKYVFKPLSLRVAGDFDGRLPLDEMLTDIALAMIQYGVERPDSIRLFMREAAAGSQETKSAIGPVVGKALQNLFDAVDAQKGSAKLSELDPVLMVATLMGVVGFYFTGFPTIMGDKLPYDPYKPENVDKLRSSVKLFVRLLMQARHQKTSR